MRVQQYFFDNPTSVGPPGQSASPTASYAVRLRRGARRLTFAGLLGLLLVGAGCESAPPVEKSAPVAETQPAPASEGVKPTVIAPPDSATMARADSMAAASWGRAADSIGGVGAAARRAMMLAARARFVGLRDTIGNGKASRLIGGAFNPATLRYRRDPAVPLMLKLARRTTLMVGVNSSENRLYQLFTNKKVPAGTLTQPLALDRLAFEPGQARLGAEAAQQLGSLAALMHTFPKVRLQLSGHAAPTEPQAATLPAARAQACLAELLKQGVAPARLSVAPAVPKPGDPNPQGLSVRVVAR